MVWNNYTSVDRSSFVCEEMPMAVSLTQVLQSLLQIFEYENKLCTIKYEKIKKKCEIKFKINNW